MTGERRGAYRVQIQEDDALEIVIRTESSSHSGRTLDISRRGIAAQFALDAVPSLPLNKSFEVSLAAPWLPDGIETKARVSSRQRGASFWRYGFEFDESDAFDRLTGDQFRLFNRRATYRVAPLTGEVVAVGIALPGAPPEVNGAMKDVSAGGIGVRVRATEEARSITEAEFVDVSFRLPPVESTLRITARIVAARLESDAIVYGMAFSPDLTRDFESHEAVIMKYVMQRQREELKKGLGAQKGS